MEKITVTPYLAGTVNHAMMVMKRQRLLTINLAPPWTKTGHFAELLLQC